MRHLVTNCACLPSGDKAHVSTILGIAQLHRWAHLIRTREAVFGHDGVVRGVEDEGRHIDTAHVLFA